MPDLQILSAFRQINILKDLSLESQTLLASFATVRSIRKGETLFCQGEPSPYCFGILSGSVTLRHSDPSGAIKTQVYEAGRFLGGASLLHEMQRPGLASVTQDGELLSVWSSRFRNWKTESPEKTAILSDIQKTLDATPNP